ncbi:copia protein [Tanacetum coccineum]
MTVVGARETVGSQVVQQTGIQCFNCKEFRHFTKECRKPKRAKHYTYHKKKMLMCKQAEKGVPLQAEQVDWLEDTDEEINKQELEAHYSFMAKIQKVLHTESGFDAEPLEKCQPRNQNFYEPNLCYNSNSSGFDQLPQYSIDHQPQSIQEDLKELIKSYKDELFKTMQSVVEMFRQREQAANLSTHTPEPSESEDTSNSDKECNLPVCNNYVTFSNLLFDANDDFTSSDDESLPKEDHPEENFKIYLNPLFEFDEEYISSDINPFYNEVLEDIKNKDSYVSNLDEPALLVTPLSDANEDECFDPGGDIDEIDVDVSMDIKDGYHDLERDIIYLKCLLINDTTYISLPRCF